MKNYTYEKLPEAVIPHTDFTCQTSRPYAMFSAARTSKDKLFISAGPLRSSAAPLRSNDRISARFQYRDWGKQALDTFMVLLIAPSAFLMIGFCAIALWLEGGQPFYRQDRLGQHGRKFSILKLRTMVRDADKRLESCLAADPELRKEWDRTQKLKNDPRITRLGAILRKTSLDELPQIWNVLKGDMSLVGPRPMMPEQLPMYGDARPYFAMRPGITGSWQVSARNEKAFSHRAKMDAEYFHNVSLGHDLKLLLKTVAAVVRRTGY